MRPFENTSTEVMKKLLAAYTASYGRMMTQEEAIDCEKTIGLINMELKLRSGEKERNLRKTAVEKVGGFVGKWL